MMRVTGAETVQVTPLRRTLASSQRAVKRLWCVCVWGGGGVNGGSCVQVHVGADDGTVQ